MSAEASLARRGSPREAGSAVRRLLWAAGWPARATLCGLICAYRVLLGGVFGGQCRFYPSCSHYAEGAVRARGAVVGGALAAWRILRCSPLSAGGFDPPPATRSPAGAGKIRFGYAAEYEIIIRARKAAS